MAAEKGFLSSLKYLGGAAWGDYFGRRVMLGAGLGAAYGYYDDRDWFGGAVMGGLLGGAIGAIGATGALSTEGKMGLAGAGLYHAELVNALAVGKTTRGKAIARALGIQAKASVGYIGSTLTNAYNGFKALW